MGWIVGVIVFIGSLVIYMESRTRKIKKMTEEIELLEGQIERAQEEKQLREDVVEIQKEAAKKAQEIQEDHEILEDKIPDPETSEELTDEAKQSVAAISSHIADRYRKRMPDRR